MTQPIKVAVPAGIGDVSWIWSKLISLGTSVEIFVPKGYPARTYPWLKLLPGVIPGIGNHGYNDLYLQMMIKGWKTWEEAMACHKEGEIIYLQPNRHFLDGGTLSEWIPDLKTNYHYPINISKEDKDNALKMIDGNKLNIGIHMACRKGNLAWETWLPKEWEDLLRLLAKDFPEVQFILLGGLWDLDNGMELQGRLKGQVKILDLIGKTNISEVISILDSLVYYIGYSSGLNVMMNVLGKPCTALWPSWQDKHMYGHADPEMVAKREYLGFQYDDPEVIYYRVKNIIKKRIDQCQTDLQS